MKILTKMKHFIRANNEITVASGNIKCIAVCGLGSYKRIECFIQFSNIFNRVSVKNVYLFLKDTKLVSYNTMVICGFLSLT